MRRASLPILPSRMIFRSLSLSLARSPGLGQYEAFPYSFRLGDPVDLIGWKGYNGGLDTSSEGYTGKKAIFVPDEAKRGPIMFHVCPMIPEYPSDPTRKRYDAILIREIQFGFFADDSVLLGILATMSLLSSSTKAALLSMSPCSGRNSIVRSHCS